MGNSQSGAAAEVALAGGGLGSNQSNNDQPVSRGPAQAPMASNGWFNYRSLLMGALSGGHMRRWSNAGHSGCNCPRCHRYLVVASNVAVFRCPCGARVYSRPSGTNPSNPVIRTRNPSASVTVVCESCRLMIAVPPTTRASSITCACGEQLLNPHQMNQLMGVLEHVSRTRGARPSLVSLLPTHMHNQSGDAANSVDPEAESCCICLQDYEEKEILTTLPCMHSYHASCMEKWFAEHSTCPLCNTKLEDIFKREKAFLTSLKEEEPQQEEAPAGNEKALEVQPPSPIGKCVI